MPPVEDRQEEQRNQNWSPANGFGLGSGEFSLHYLKPVEESWTLLIGKVAQPRSELAIIECLLFFVKQIQLSLPYIVKIAAYPDVADFRRKKMED